MVVAATYLPTMRSAVFPSVASSGRCVGKKVRGGWEEEGRKKYKCRDNNSNSSMLRIENFSLDSQISKASPTTQSNELDQAHPKRH